MNFQLRFLATVQSCYKSVDYLYFSKGFFLSLIPLGEFARSVIREKGEGWHLLLGNFFPFPCKRRLQVLSQVRKR